VVLGLSEPILSGKAYAKPFVLAYSGWMSQKQSQQTLLMHTKQWMFIGGEQNLNSIELNDDIVFIICFIAIKFVSWLMNFAIDTVIELN